MNIKKLKAHPLVIVFLTLVVIEISMTVLYPSLTYTWELVPVLLVICLVPLSIIATFIYLWIKRPGYLYPPSEFKSDSFINDKFVAYKCKNEVVNKLMYSKLANLIMKNQGVKYSGFDEQNDRSNKDENKT